MADTKISGLDELTVGNLASGDWIPIVDVSDSSMAASGTTKKLAASALVQTANNQTVAGFKNFSDGIIATLAVASGFRTGEILLNDDAATSITPASANGALLVYYGTSNDDTIFALVTFRASVPTISALFSGSIGSNIGLSTSALTGTTGTDGRLNIGANGGLIYFENRRGGSRNFKYVIFA